DPRRAHLSEPYSVCYAPESRATGWKYMKIPVSLAVAPSTIIQSPRYTLPFMRRCHYYLDWTSRSAGIREGGCATVSGRSPRNYSGVSCLMPYLQFGYMAVLVIKSHDQCYIDPQRRRRRWFDCCQVTP